MRIAIFGDSFSTVNDYFQQARPQGVCWAQLLADQYTVDNFSANGTGLAYSYQKFCQNLDYDRVIFAAGANHRLYLENIETEDPTLKHVDVKAILDKKVGDAWIQHRFHKEPSIDWDTILEFAQQYFRYVYSSDTADAIDQLQLAHVKSTNSLLLPCFESTLVAQPEIFDTCRIALSNITEAENTLCNTTFAKLTKLKKQTASYAQDTRHCHMSDENNQMLYEKIVTWIDTGEFALSDTDIQTPAGQTLEPYIL